MSDGQGPGSTSGRSPDRPLVRVGTAAWSVLGVAGVVVVFWLLATRLAAVTVPLLVALFPAAMLAPAVSWLHRHRWPRALATAVVVPLTLVVVGGLIALVVPRVLAEAPELVGALTRSGSRLDELVHRMPGIAPDTTPGDLVRQGVLAVAGGVNTVLRTVLTLALGLVLAVVLVFCYLGGGPRIVATALSLLPQHRRGPTRALLDEIWGTLGAYVRGLVLVALFDATLVGVGLTVLGVPLALPLAVLVFLGGFVPYMGAFASGLAAVLVALASGGLGTAAAVLALIIVVQQLDGNLVQPLVMGRVIRLSAFTVIVAVTVGAALLGVLGAFLAVPAAASVSRALAFVRERRREPSPP